MKSLLRWWKVNERKFLDLAISIFAVVVFSHYAATKPANHLQKAVLKSSGDTSVNIYIPEGSRVTANDIERSYWCVNVSTNTAVSYVRPANGVVWESWTRRGAFCDWFYLDSSSSSPFHIGTNCFGRIAVLAGGKIRPNIRAVNEEIAALPQSVSAVPGISRFWSAITPYDSHVLSWCNFRYARGAGENVSAQIELFSSGDFVCRSNLVEQAYVRVSPFDWDRDGLANDIDLEPYVHNGDYHGQTVSNKNFVLDTVGVALTNGYYALSVTFPTKPSLPTLVSVGTNKMVVAAAGEYFFLLEKGIEYNIHVEPMRDDIIYDYFDDLSAIQNKASSKARSIDWWGDGATGSNWHSYIGQWTLVFGYVNYFWPYFDSDGYIVWWPNFKGSPDLDDLPTDGKCVFSGDFIDCHVDIPAEYHWKNIIGDATIVSPHSKTTEIIGVPSELSDGVLSVTATVCGNEFESCVGGRDHLNTNGLHAGMSVSSDYVVFRGGNRRPLGVSAYTNDEYLLPLPNTGTVTLSINSGAEHIKLWSQEEGGEELTLPITWSMQDFEGFLCYVEGLSASTEIEKAEFLLTYSGDAGTQEDTAETYICNKPIIDVPSVVGVNDDDDNDNGEYDWLDKGALEGDDDVVPMRIIAQLPPGVGGVIGFRAISSLHPTIWKDYKRSSDVHDREVFSVPASGLFEHTYYVESSTPSSSYNDSQIVVDISCGAAVVTNSHYLTFVSRVAEPITTERVDDVIINPCGAVVNEVTRMRVGVEPIDFPDEKIIWSAVRGNVTFVGSNTGRDVAFMADGSSGGEIVLEVDFDGCPGRKPQFSLGVCTPRRIPVYPCEVISRSSSPVITESHVKSMLDEVNIIFRQVGLSFYLGASITNIVNQDFARYGLMRRDCMKNIRNIMNNTSGVEIYFIQGLEYNNNLYDDQPRGSANKYGIVVKNSISAITLAHEIGHLCGWKDIYFHSNGYTPGELNFCVSQEWLPNDWNNGTGYQFYPKELTQAEVIRRLLMLGNGSATRGDIASGNVYGLIIERIRNYEGEIIKESSHLGEVFVGNAPPFNSPITR